jgi:hypothetical protein
MPPSAIMVTVIGFPAVRIPVMRTVKIITVI